MLPRRPQSVLFITFLVLIVVSSGAGELFLYMFSGKSLRRMGRRFPDLYSCSYFTTSREIWNNITLPLKTHREKAALATAQILGQLSYCIPEG